LSGNHIGDAGATALTSARHFSLLTSLDLSGNRCLGDAVREKLKHEFPEVVRF
jgi:hypothetical protein